MGFLCGSHFGQIQGGRHPGVRYFNNFRTSSALNSRLSTTALNSRLSATALNSRLSTNVLNGRQYKQNTHCNDVSNFLQKLFMDMPEII